MNNTNQIRMTKIMQDKFYSFFAPYKQTLTLPAYKALCDISRGILSSGSVIVNQGAIKLSEKTTPKKTAERFYRNLKRPGMHVTLRNLFIKRQCRHIDDETLILVDGSDIIKPEATRMEGLAKVHDGSTGRHDQQGYQLLNIIACRKQEHGYRILPVSSDLYSSVLEPDSISSLVQDRLNDITVHSNNKGIYVFDRGFDSRQYLDYLVGQDNAFIIRATGTRNLMIGGNEYSFREVCQALEMKYQIPGASPDQHFRCGVRKVGIRTSPHPKSNAESVEVFLVVAQYQNHHGRKRKGKQDKRDGYFYLFCNFPHHNLSEYEIIRKALSLYRLRWRIEQVHRQLKQDYKWESMQLMSYEGLKNMNMIFWMAISFLYASKAQIMQWAEVFPRQFGQYRKHLMKLFDFVYPALMKAVKIIFENWSKYDYGATETEPLQLRVRFV